MMGTDDQVLMTLGRWSLGLQLGIVCLLALFFSALARTVRREEVRLWAMAWLADAIAIAAVFITAFVHPPSWSGRLWLVAYAAAKTSFVLLVVAGTRHHQQPGSEMLGRRRHLAAMVALWSVAIGFLSPKLVHAQLGQALMVGGVLTCGAVWVLRHPRLPRSRWLGWALLAEGLVFAHYVPFLAPALWDGASLSSHLRYSSFLDAGAELLLALATLVALEATSNEHLRHAIRELELSQERLRQLVDLDPLTKLSNRRGLRAELNRAQPIGAAVIFMDIDGFKSVNDRFGHAVGDACLIRLAAVLARSFRPEDALLRWGGDEFLVVAPGMDLDGAHRRVATFRAELARPVEAGPPIMVSAGIAVLAPGGEPDQALREADLRMYADRAERFGLVSRGDGRP
jgi:diguanylate cyclase (GGDEF)-like protein